MKKIDWTSWVLIAVIVVGFAVFNSVQREKRAREQFQQLMAEAATDAYIEQRKQLYEEVSQSINDLEVLNLPPVPPPMERRPIYTEVVAAPALQPTGDTAIQPTDSNTQTDAELNAIIAASKAEAERLFPALKDNNSEMRRLYDAERMRLIDLQDKMAELPDFEVRVAKNVAAAMEAAKARAVPFTPQSPAPSVPATFKGKPLMSDREIELMRLQNEVENLRLNGKN